MPTRILVPLDGSARAESALPVAARIARASGAALVLVQVASLPVTLAAAPARWRVQALPQVIAEAEQYLRAVAQTSPAAGGAVVPVACAGAVAPTLLAVARSYRCDLIVLTSQGCSGARRWALGSVAHKLVCHSPVPVLVVQPGRAPLPGMRPEGAPVRALVPLDGSVAAKAALEPAARVVTALAAPERGALHLLRVVPPLVGEGQPVRAAQAERLQEEARGKARRYLRAVARHLQVSRPDQPPLSITWSVVGGEDCAQAILTVAEVGQPAPGAGSPGRCDLIAMAAQGRRGLPHGGLGSITERVLSATRLPILIVRPAHAEFHEATSAQGTFAGVEPVEPF